MRSKAGVAFPPVVLVIIIRDYASRRAGEGKFKPGVELVLVALPARIVVLGIFGAVQRIEQVKRHGNEPGKLVALEAGEDASHGGHGRGGGEGR